VTRIAVLGLGEAGGRIARDLEVAGAEVSGFDPAVADGAPDAQAAVDGCDLVLSLNSAAVAHAVAKDALPALREDAIYADLNTSAPALKRGLAELVGTRLVDVALLGPVPMRGLATPSLASGPHANEFAAIIGPLGMPVEVVSDVAGDAAQRKLLRSVFMKGVAAAALESLAAAERAGERDWLYDEIAAVLGPSLLDRFVEGSRTHAVRRVEEMEAAADLLRELGVEPHVATASGAVLRDLTKGEA
jgi:3-hydroxyisobutyrate dehydrogenase-like beta-hydroxyacid dehydrogenase